MARFGMDRGATAGFGHDFSEFIMASGSQPAYGGMQRVSIQCLHSPLTVHFHSSMWVIGLSPLHLHTSHICSLFAYHPSVFVLSLPFSQQFSSTSSSSSSMAHMWVVEVGWGGAASARPLLVTSCVISAGRHHLCDTPTARSATSRFPWEFASKSE